jgi:hypothetical protein
MSTIDRNSSNSPNKPDSAEGFLWYVIVNIDWGDDDSLFHLFLLNFSSFLLNCS